jgi:hypothetical protein
MTEQERIEGINSEQLATATDRVLLAARFGRARPSSPRTFSYGLYAPQGDAPLYAPQTRARGSSPEIHVRAISSRNDEHTVFTRRPKHYKAEWRKFATISLVTSLISVAAAIALLV